MQIATVSKRMSLLNDLVDVPQAIDFVDQQAVRPLRKDDGEKENAAFGTNVSRHDASYCNLSVVSKMVGTLRFAHPTKCRAMTVRTAYFFPTFSHSHCATASGELVASLPAARRLASRIVAMSILPSSGASALRKPSSLARFGASSTIAS